MITQMIRNWTLLFMAALTLVLPVSAQAEPMLSGEVVETMNSGGYSYALMENEGKQAWIAVPQTKISKGDQVEFHPGLEMGSYTSPTLGRTFDNIVFSGGVKSIKRLEAEQPAEEINIAKAEGENSYTIEELYSQKSELAGKKIMVRGKVSKSSKFLGLTWLRLKDGTGSRKKGNHKLVVTTEESAEKGETVTISGTVALGKSVGGLSYDMIIEQATIGKE